MFDVAITVVKVCCHQDLIDKYEIPQERPCDMRKGMRFISKNAEQPEGLCDPAWNVMKSYVKTLSEGGEHIFGDWMKDPRSAMVSCDDGFRPVSFYLEAID